MNGNKKRLPWRCKNQQQAKDKAAIYNSKEWKELRIQKLRANPLCERCASQNHVRSAHCVHHITPIETAATMEEMRRLAFNPANLMSLCDECHHKIHEEMRSFDPANVKARADARQARWADNIVNRFLLPAHSESEYTEYEEIKEDNGIQKEVHTGLIREPSADRASEAQAQTDSQGNSNNPHEMG